MDDNFQPTSSSTSSNNNYKTTIYMAIQDIVIDSSWYADSGAINHVTIEMNNLSLKKPYEEQDKLMIGNDIHTSPTLQPSMSLSLHAPTPCRPMITRAKAGILKPKVYASLKHPLSFSPGPIEPMCVKLQGPGLIDLKMHYCSGVFKIQFDVSFFLYKTKGIIFTLLVYVDDILITRNNSTTISDSIHDLNKSFLLKDLGSLHYFLRNEAFQEETSPYLTQSKHIADMLQKINMDIAKPLPTLVIFGKVLFKSNGDLMDNPTMYRNTVGALQYVTITRPDISYMVNADYASYPDDRRSTSGYCVYLGGNLISWSSKKQSVVARSSIESEYRALAHVTTKVIWLKSLTIELGLQVRLRLAI
uniref:Reverse transcriptase Ty1/copia-type domain-containing protein n=1 Tax=Vitis vinifera TaxID=29760 RepID=A5AXA2_VITVI|nr:hypothetical protein VITISV_028827 [Vitis vinifera]